MENFYNRKTLNTTFRVAIKRNLGHLVGFSSCKMPLGIMLGLHSIPPLIGLFTIANDVKGSNWEKYKLFMPLLLMLSHGTVPLVVEGKWLDLVRLGHVVALIAFSFFVASKTLYWLKEKNKFLNQYAMTTSVLAYLVITLEILIVGDAGPKYLLGMEIPRYKGLFGESNYSSMILLVSTILHLHYKRFKWGVLNLIVCLPLLSRGMWLSFLVFVFLVAVSKFSNKRVFQIAGATVFGSIIALPLFVLVLEWIGNIHIIEFIERLSAGRYFLWLPYIKMGVNHPFGVGFFNGELYYESFLAPYKAIADSIRGHQINEQHSIFIQIFSEFGVVGYFLIIWQMVRFFTLVKNNAILTSLFLSLLVGFSFLNGLTDYNLFLVLGLLSGCFIQK